MTLSYVMIAGRLQNMSQKLIADTPDTAPPPERIARFHLAVQMLELANECLAAAVGTPV